MQNVRKPVAFLACLLSLCLSFVDAAPVEIVKRAIDPSNGPFNITAQGAVIGVIAIISGIFLCFFGSRFIHITMFLVGFWIFANVVYIAIENSSHNISNTITLVVAIIVGLIGGAVLACCWHLAVSLLGALFGYALALWILSWKSGGVITTQTGRTIFIVVLVVVFFLVTFFFERWMVILATAFIGAFLIVLGIDMFVGTGFAANASSFLHGDTSALSDMTTDQYIMLAAVFVGFLIGAFVQHVFWRQYDYRAAAVAPAGAYGYKRWDPPRLREDDVTAYPAPIPQQISNFAYDSTPNTGSPFTEGGSDKGSDSGRQSYINYRREPDRITSPFENSPHSRERAESEYTRFESLSSSNPRNIRQPASSSHGRPVIQVDAPRLATRMNSESSELDFDAYNSTSSNERDRQRESPWNTPNIPSPAIPTRHARASSIGAPYYAASTSIPSSQLHQLRIEGDPSMISSSLESSSVASPIMIGGKATTREGALGAADAAQEELDQRSYRRKSVLVHGFGEGGQGSLTPLGNASNKNGTPTIITWTQGGNNVYVTGTFNGWKQKIRLNKSTHDFTTILDLPPGTHRLKFIVDDEWKCSNELETATDPDGNLVNYIEVEDDEMEDNALRQIPDEHAAVAANHGTEPPLASSPPGEYTTEIPIELLQHANMSQDYPVHLSPHTQSPGSSSASSSATPTNSNIRSSTTTPSEHSKTPPPLPTVPSLPPHLDKVLLNSQVMSEEDNSVLPVPNHVTLNHLYATSIRDGVMAVGSTSRYRKKVSDKGDREHNGLITMYAPGDTSDVHIPSVFVSQHQFNALLRHVNDSDTPLLVRLVKDDLLQWPLLDVILVVVMSPAFMMLFIYILWRIRQRQRRKKDLAPPSVVSSLPTKLFYKEKRKDNEPEECAICLEDYLDEDELRILPCKHEFHTGCIDGWLTTRKKFCPICKRDICQPREAAASEATPLLEA
ncbi:hypothetical protein BZG36_01484 [Bifiguratus adelaidae]|uniref:RING-type domain-containing protein n=1 Tax=Bifiguratus adelaidae TaxID=1938954 RepID=A0A261Y4Q8_9FUNG|nr:hypothetical protein BZG36_01484 [Bifiguratus adelaidae]